MNKTKADLSTVFIGEFVALATYMYSGEDKLPVPIEVQGFLLDQDETYFYLGSNSNEIDKAIKRTLVNYIQITKPKSAEEKLLDRMVYPPEEEKQIN